MIALTLSLSLLFADVVIGSKNFTESYILAEILAKQVGSPLVKGGLGSTGVTFEALKKGEIDLYPEYSGTIAESILKDPTLTEWQDIQSRLAEMGFVISKPLGFDNTYALAIRRDFEQADEINTISDLKEAKNVDAGFSYEFVNREDGFLKLREFYGLNHITRFKRMEHSLAYQSIAQGTIDLTDVYSTDAKIEALNLKVLTDDLEFFPKYQAVILARKDFVKQQPEAWASLRSLEGKIDEEDMRSLNAMVEIGKKTFKEAAYAFFQESPQVDAERDYFRSLRDRSLEHIHLVGVSLFFAVLVGLPLGLFSVHSRRWGHLIQALCSFIQTIPSLALLCFLIPVFGIGSLPALVALFLYALLPIVINTTNGILSIDQKYQNMAKALGMSLRQRIVWIEIPLASRAILAGIKTSAIISVGTATLAALIGAGGYGAPILSGLATNDMKAVLFGAIPAACLAVLVHLLFDLLSYFVIPKQL